MAEIYIFNWSTRPAAALSYVSEQIAVGYDPNESEIDADRARAIAAPLQVHNALELVMSHLSTQDSGYIKAFGKCVAQAMLVSLTTLPEGLQHDHPQHAEMFAMFSLPGEVPWPTRSLLFDATVGLSQAKFYIDDIIDQPTIHLGENQRNVFAACLDVAGWAWLSGETRTDSYRIDPYGAHVTMV